jgi:hypothetical protein
MTVYSQQAAVPSGYNDSLGVFHPSAPFLLFPARDCDSTVHLQTAASPVTIGGPDVGVNSWPLVSDQERVLTLPANEELYGYFSESVSGPTPAYAYVAVLVTELAP